MAVAPPSPPPRLSHPPSQPGWGGGVEMNFPFWNLPVWGISFQSTLYVLSVVVVVGHVVVRLLKRRGYHQSDQHQNREDIHRPRKSPVCFPTIKTKEKIQQYVQ